MKNTPYKIYIDKDYKIQIDEEELDKALKAWENKSPVVLKQGIVNMAFARGIFLDAERLREARALNATEVELLKSDFPKDTIKKLGVEE